MVGEKFHETERLCKNERESERPKKSAELYYEEFTDEEEEGEEDYEEPQHALPYPQYSSMPQYIPQLQYQPQPQRQSPHIIPAQNSDFIPVRFPPAGYNVQPSTANGIPSVGYNAADNRIGVIDDSSRSAPTFQRELAPITQAAPITPITQIAPITPITPIATADNRGPVTVHNTSPPNQIGSKGSRRKNMVYRGNRGNQNH